MSFAAEVRGDATCEPLDGRVCGQLVFDLELRSVLSDPAAPERVGRMRIEAIGSLRYKHDEQTAQWSVLSSQGVLGLIVD